MRNINSVRPLLVYIHYIHETFRFFLLLKRILIYFLALNVNCLTVVLFNCRSRVAGPQFCNFLSKIMCTTHGNIQGGYFTLKVHKKRRVFSNEIFYHKWYPCFLSFYLRAKLEWQIKNDGMTNKVMSGAETHVHTC